jgi:uncharacterized protein (DUF433 family)
LSYRDADDRMVYSSATRAALRLYKHQKVDHNQLVKVTCGEDLCVNPDHLILVSRYDRTPTPYERKIASIEKSVVEEEQDSTLLDEIAEEEEIDRAEIAEMLRSGKSEAAILDEMKLTQEQLDLALISIIQEMRDRDRSSAQIARDLHLDLSRANALYLKTSGLRR